MANIECRFCSFKSPAAEFLSNQELETLGSNCAQINFKKGEIIHQQRRILPGIPSAGIQEVRIFQVKFLAKSFRVGIDFGINPLAEKMGLILSQAIQLLSQIRLEPGMEDHAPHPVE